MSNRIVTENYILNETQHNADGTVQWTVYHKISKNTFYIDLINENDLQVKNISNNIDNPYEAILALSNHIIKNKNLVPSVKFSH